MPDNLTHYIKYCLGYVKLTRDRSFVSQQKQSLELSQGYFNIDGLLNGDEDGAIGETIKLDVFYKYDPRRVPEELKQAYDEERSFANKIEEIYNRYRNDPFTKQIALSFGYFEIEIPIAQEETEDTEVDELDSENLPLLSDKKPKTKIDRFPLFSVPVRVEKEEGKYYAIYTVDPEIQINVGFLQDVLGEDLYYPLVEDISKFEIEGKLSFPFEKREVFMQVWKRIKDQLKLKDAIFDEDSFVFDEVRLSLSSKVNYFLAEDLQKLAAIEEKDLEGTSLVSWIQDKDLNLEEGIPEEKDLFFPFLYDKYKLRVLSLLGNKASIVEGPPGTGKSETIANLLAHLSANGKKVLFVSQKTQALKVVKDKLKSLDVAYLYGYVPNPSSAQLTEEDENDGIAPQLSALGSYIEKISYHHNAISNEKDIADTVAVKDQNKSHFNRLLEHEREVFELNNELVDLEKFAFPLTDRSCFESTFSEEAWREIQGLEGDIDRIGKEIKEYEGAEERKKFEAALGNLDLGSKQYSDHIESIRKDVEKTGFDRRSNFFRKVNHTARNVRLLGVRSQFPRELIECIDQVLLDDLSRTQQLAQLEKLYRHCKFHEDKVRLDVLKSKLQKEIGACGITSRELTHIKRLTKEVNIQEIRKNILRIEEIKETLRKGELTWNPNTIARDWHSNEKERRKQVAQYLQNIIDKNLLTKYKQSISVKQITKKLSKAFGKSRRAFKTFDKLKKEPDHFGVMLDLIPVWIMELDDASRLLPLEAGLFDYVILDEASQCNIAYTLPVMYRGERAIFVGDSEQMRDSTVMFKANKAFDELARRYKIPEELQIKSTGASVQSVLDIAGLRGFSSIPLRYHYRSPRELIGFSNEYFYKPKGKELIPLNNNYLTFKDTERVMLIHEIEANPTKEISDKVSIAEAKAILDLFKEIRADPRCEKKSIGILSFFNAQAAYIRELFESEGFKEEGDNYKISIIEGIQGDEKDIVIYSFVIRSADQRNKYMPLTGEGGDIRGDINNGRVNVAFSRARLQVHCFVSMPVAEMPERIWIKKYLQYVLENGKVDANSTVLKPFDSYFEQEFYGTMKSKFNRGYKIQNQVESCGFKIDFVLHNTKTGKRIAIECDGPTHFKNEIDQEYGLYVETDQERQDVLEAAGWRFYRLKYSDWINKEFDRDHVMNDLSKLLA